MEIDLVRLHRAFCFHEAKGFLLAPKDVAAVESASSILRASSSTFESDEWLPTEAGAEATLFFPFLPLLLLLLIEFVFLDFRFSNS